MPISSLHPNNTRAEYFRYLYCNSTAVQFTGQEAILTFAIQKNPANPNDGSEEQVAVGMSSSTLKSIAYTLTKIIESFEKTNNIEIPVSPELIGNVETIIAETEKAAKK